MLRHARISRTSSVVISSSSAISSGRGSRPSRCTSCRSMCTTLLSFSTMCTGMRIVRALSAIARVTAWPYPPGRVRRELVAAPVVELLDCPYEAQRPLLDEVEEGQSPPEIRLRDRHDEAEVRLDHLPLREHVAALDALCEIDLLVGGQELHLADLAEVEPERVSDGSTERSSFGIAFSSSGGCSWGGCLCCSPSMSSMP